MGFISRDKTTWDIGRTEEKPINHKLKASDFRAQISTHFVLKLDQNLHSLQI